MSNNIIAGLTQGHNYSKKLDLSEWKDVLIVDRNYFIKNIDELTELAMNKE